MKASSEQTSPYIDDIKEQPAALLRQADAPLPAELKTVHLDSYDRIILTGMGSSDYAGIPIERALAARGLPVLRLDAGQLLDIPERVTNRSLVWATSQSGRSGEVVALAGALVGAHRPRTLIGTTNDASSPLAEMSDILLELHSGNEATVSTKSYLNTLAVQQRALAVLTGESASSVDTDIRATAEEVSDIVEKWALQEELAENAWNRKAARFAYVGIQDDSSTALTGALITKEASKVPVEGYIGGEFRHGPLELAGEGLTVVLFGPGNDSDAFLPNLARDLVSSGSTVLTVGPRPYARTTHLVTPSRNSMLSRLAVGSVQVQLLTIAFSRATGEVAGQFRFGQKITAAL